MHFELTVSLLDIFVSAARIVIVVLLFILQSIRGYAGAFPLIVDLVR